ncbi:AbrB/MazE/SpoVT family DNA-binding domain-containing protein [Candidatus Woesearchaeota archaeon]|nr:AbrB/MazE/SpoVT family DNA-binding domain-containing protein [Candidatus Woesearchaeota archaeon]
MPRLQSSKNRFSLTIPANVIRLLGWQKGDHIDLESDLKGRLYLKKASSMRQQPHDEIEY